MNAFADSVLKKWADYIMEKRGSIAIPADNDEEMNWHAFFAHSQDMQGFRADYFTFGNPALSFGGLRKRAAEAGFSASGSDFICELGAVWQDSEIRERLEKATAQRLSDEQRSQGLQPMLLALSRSGNRAGALFAESLEQFKGAKIAWKKRGMIRAYVQNCNRLAQFGGDFRAYLKDRAGGTDPIDDAVKYERKVIGALAGDLYNVAGTLASYMICDVMLWYWMEGEIDWFESYKCDSTHVKAVGQGKLPEWAESQAGFVKFCREEVRLPTAFGKGTETGCPPRILNECFWLEFNESEKPQ